MLKDKKIFGKFNLIDFSILAFVLLLVVGFLLAKTGVFKPIAKVSTGVKPVEFVVVTRAYEVTAEDEIFKKGDVSFITIRNVPYTKLEIVDVKKEKMMEMFFNNDRPEVPYLIDNIAYPNRFQYKITLKDNAQVTADGAVIGGNKIKIGLPVDLEGFNYRMSGTVSDVRILEEEQK